MGGNESKPQPGPQNNYEVKIGDDEPETLPSYKINKTDSKQISDLHTSIRSSTPPSDQFILEPLESLSIKENKRFVYYWLDMNVYNQENDDYLKFLTSKNISVQEFASMQGLQDSMKKIHPKKRLKIICAASLSDQIYKKFQKNPRISQVFLFCKNREKAKELMINYPIIKHPSFEIGDLKNAIKQSQKYDSLYYQRKNVLFNIPEDTNELNKLRMNYYCYISVDFDRQRAKKDFVEYAKIVYPQEIGAIKYFEKEYNVNLSRAKRIEQTVQFMSENSFFWKAIKDAPQSSYLAKQLAYIRLPLRDIEEAIGSGYFKMDRNSTKEVYMVLQLSEDEKKKFESNVNNYVNFTSFAKAYTSEPHARGYFKRQKRDVPNIAFLRIILQPENMLDEDIDFGYWKDPNQQRVDELNFYFNLFNFFKISEVIESEIILVYGGISYVSEVKKNPRKIIKPTQYDDRLWTNYEFIRGKYDDIHCQNDIIKFDNIRESSQIQLKRTELLKSVNVEPQIMEMQRKQMGQFYFLNEQYTKAEKEFDSILQPKIRKLACLSLAKLYLKTEKYTKFDGLKAELIECVNHFKETYPKKALEGMYYLGLDHLMKAKYKSARNQFNKSIEFCENSNISISSSPVGHEIMKALSRCYLNSGSISESKVILETTKKWEEICEGNNSSSLLKTENEFLNVYMKEQNEKKAEESKININEITRNVDIGDHYYIENSSIDMDILFLNQSTIQIDESQILDESCKEIKIGGTLLFEDF